jgi:hypothetical protein
VTVSSAVVVVVALVLSGVYLSWTAGRLDRMHARVDAAWAALDAQLARRAAAARDLAHCLPGPAGARLATAAQASLDAGEADREAVENDLSRALRAALPDLPPDTDLAELTAATSRVRLARTVHNTAVTDTLALRRRRLPRLFRLAGRRTLPSYFEIDDTQVLERGSTAGG